MGLFIFVYHYNIFSAVRSFKINVSSSVFFCLCCCQYSGLNEVTLFVMFLSLCSMCVCVCAGVCLGDAVCVYYLLPVRVHQQGLPGCALCHGNT